MTRAGRRCGATWNETKASCPFCPLYLCYIGSIKRLHQTCVVPPKSKKARYESVWLFLLGEGEEICLTTHHKSGKRKEKKF